MAEVHGILSMIKPPEWTSMDVVRRVRRLTGQKKAGHAGTLDPQATGVLPVCIGQATRVMEYLVDSPKTYAAVVRLGEATDSYDALGQVTETADASGVTLGEVDAALDAYRGVFGQVPPMFSALKRDGKRLYDLARAGVEVARPPREVEIYRLEVREWSPPEVRLEIDCGRGMYVRSLAHDLGVDLGCGGHLKELSRLRSGPFRMGESITFEELESACEGGDWRRLLFAVDHPLLHLRAAIVGREKEEAMRRGESVFLGLRPGGEQDGLCRAYSAGDGRFVGLLGPARARGQWRPVKVFRLPPS